MVRSFPFVTYGLRPPPPSRPSVDKKKAVLRVLSGSAQAARPGPPAGQINNKREVLSIRWIRLWLRVWRSGARGEGSDGELHAQACRNERETRQAEGGAYSCKGP